MVLGKYSTEITWQTETQTLMNDGFKEIFYENDMRNWN